MKINRQALLLLRLMGFMTGATGLLVMAGWLMNSAALVQLRPAFEPMKFNTALLFAFLGAGYACLGVSPRRLPQFMGFAVALAALLTLSQYALHVDYGIDTAFIKPLIQKRTVFPGRFSVNTGLGFILAGLGLALLGNTANRGGQRQLALLAVTGTLLTAIVLPALLGYLTGTEEYSVFGLSFGMAPHTAVLFLLLGIAHLRIVALQPSENIGWLPASLLFLLLVMTSAFSQAAENDHRSELAAVTKAEAASAARNAELYLDGLFRAIDRMDHRWEMERGTPRALWEEDATAYLHAYPVLYSLSWVNTASRLQWLVSLQPMKDMTNFYVAFEPNRKKAIDDAIATRLPQMTDAIELVQGGQGFVAYNPLFIGGRYAGLITSAFNIDNMFATLLSADDRRNFKITVAEKGRGIYDSGAQADAGGEDLKAIATSSIRGKKWVYTLTPTPAFMAANASALPRAVFLIGLIISLLAALSLHFGIGERATRRLLRHSAGQLAYFVKHIPVAFAVCDRDMRYLMVSDRWYSDFNLKQTDVTGLSHFQVFHKAPESWTQILLECLKSGTPSSAEDRIVFPSGRVMWLRWNLRPWHDPSGAIAGLLMATEIVTERKEAEETLRQARNTADAANDAKTSFLADMSHEIRTPMNAVIGMTRMLLRTSLDRDQRHYAETVVQSAESLMHLITDILDLSKIEAGKTELEKLPFDLKKLCTQISEVFQLQAEVSPQRGGTGEVRFHLEFDARCEGFVYGDPLRLRQILNNLCANALKFTREGTVTLKVEPGAEAGKIKFSVIDTGIGIAPEKLDTIFSKFSQADETITRRYGGTGLGLAISSNLAALMGGNISVASTLGRGSEFSFTIELAPAEEVFDRGSTAAGVELQWFDNARILLAEDSMINQEVISSFLRRSGITVTIVNNGQEAVDIIKAQDFDLIIMDGKMPVMDGFAATKAIRALGGNKAQLPIIALTANALAGDREKCLAAGMNDYISKPIQQERLLGVINAWLPDAKKGIEISGAGLAPAFDNLEALDLVIGDIDPVMMEETRSALGSRFDDTLARFMAETERLLEDIRAAAVAGDAETAANIAHVVKASSLQFGAPKVGSHMANIQRAGDEGQLAEILPLLNAALKDWENFKTALARRRS